MKILVGNVTWTCQLACELTWKWKNLINSNYGGIQAVKLENMCFIVTQIVRGKYVNIDKKRDLTFFNAAFVRFDGWTRLEVNKYILSGICKFGRTTLQRCWKYLQIFNFVDDSQNVEFYCWV